MARNATLLQLLHLVRTEAKVSLNPANNAQARDTHVALIQREQERLWGDFAWPHLRVKRYRALAAGQRFYAPPSDVTVDNIEEIHVKEDGVWRRLEYGISDGHYRLHDSDIGQRSWPAHRWQMSEQDEIEIWPVPDRNGSAVEEHAPLPPPTTEPQSDPYQGVLRITGKRNLRPLIADADKADIDDHLIALYVAGGLLAASSPNDAKLRLQAAAALDAKLRGKQMKNETFSMFSTRAPERPRRSFVTRYVPPADGHG